MALGFLVFLLIGFLTGHWVLGAVIGIVIYAVK